MNLRLLSLLLVLGVSGVWWGAGCASKTLTKVGDGQEAAQQFPPDLPAELQKKFEIRDTSQEATSTEVALPSSAPASSPDLKKNKKKGPIVKAQMEPPAFVYPNRRPPKDPIWLNEAQVFHITYFGMVAGVFTLRVLPPKMINDRKVYHVRGNARSSSLFSLFYRLDDMVESFFDYEGLFSHRLHLTLDETRQTRDSLELNDAEKKRSFFWNRWNHKVKGYIEIKDFFPIEPFSQDTLSALYYLRTLDLPDGAVVTFPVASEGKCWDAVVTVLRREMIDGPRGKVRAIVLKPETKYQGVLKKQGDSFIWLSDDDRRFLLRLEARVKIGSVVAVLKNIELGTPLVAEPPLMQPGSMSGVTPAAATAP